MTWFDNDHIAALTCPDCAWWCHDIPGVTPPDRCPECQGHHSRVTRLVPVWITAEARAS